MIYLATPYTHPSAEVRGLRFQAVTAAAGALMRRVSVVYSPITDGHVIHEATGLPEEWEFWRRQSLGMLDRADMLAVLELAGWQTSTGVKEEIAFAEGRGIPVVWLKEGIVPERIIVDLEKALAEAASDRASVALGLKGAS